MKKDSDIVKSVSKVKGEEITGLQVVFSGLPLRGGGPQLEEATSVRDSDERFKLLKDLLSN